MRETILASAICVAVALTGTASAKTKKPEDPNKVICRVTMNSGSHIGQTRVCMTWAEWRLDDAARHNEAEADVRRTWDQREQEALRGGNARTGLGPN
jgi:hypothetical protein